MKKVIILEHGGGELANQLWNYISIFAYAKEMGYSIENPSFFEYGKSFNIQQNPLVNILLFRPFLHYRGRRTDLLPTIWRKIYKLVTLIISTLYRGSIIRSNDSDNDVYYIPPTIASSQQLSNLENTGCKRIFFSGWLFRNPKGIVKFREEIIQYFRPVPSVENASKTFIDEIRSKYGYVVGVHIRQGDYRTFKDGKYWIEQGRVRDILNEFIKFKNLDLTQTCFAIASDGRIDQENFKGLNFKISTMGSIEDLFMLSKVDIIIGSDSSFGDFAAYYGNIPHIIFKKENMDWSYYEDKDKFFENKYCTMVHY